MDEGLYTDIEAGLEFGRNNTESGRSPPMPRGWSPRGNVAESCAPLRYLEALDSGVYIQEPATRARAIVVPDTADTPSSTADSQLDGGRDMTLALAGTLLSGGRVRCSVEGPAVGEGGECWIRTFEPVGFSGILIGAGVCLRGVECDED